MANKTKKEASVRVGMRGKRHSGRGRPKNTPPPKKPKEEKEEKDMEIPTVIAAGGHQSNGSQKKPKGKGMILFLCWWI